MREGSRWLLAAASACHLLWGCQNGFFACESDEACNGGICASPGYCAFEDPDCDTGYRYGAHARDGLSGQCVPGTTSATTGGTSATAGSDSSASTQTSADEGPTSTTGTGVTTSVPETCGNGTLDPGEDCDDANAVDGDGCNVDCQVSGQRVWSVVFDGGSGGTDSGRDVVWIDDRIAVAGRVDIDGDSALDLRLYEGDGTEVWSVQVGQPGAELGAWGIDVLDGTIVVAGQGTADPPGYVAAFDTAGNELWSGPDQAVIGFDVALDASGDVWISGDGQDDQARLSHWAEGSSIETLTAPLPMAPSTAWDLAVVADSVIAVGMASDGSASPFVYDIAVDTGSLNWSASLDMLAESVAIALGIAVADDGKIAVSGWWRPEVTDDGWVAVLTPDGSEVLWTATMGSPAGDDNVHKVAFGPDGSVVGVGWEAIDDATQALWVGKWDADGNSLWTDTVEGDAGSPNNLWGVAVADDGSIAVSGHVTVAGNSVDHYVARYTP